MQRPSKSSPDLLLLWKKLPLRQYTKQEVEAFLREDVLDAEAEQIAKRFVAGADPSSHS